MEKYTKEVFQEKLDNIYGKNTYIILTFDEKTKQSEILHTKCNNTFETHINELVRKRNHELRNRQCTKCPVYDQYKDRVWLQEQLDLATNSRIEIIDSNPSWRYHTALKCRVCGHEWSTSAIRQIVNRKRKTDSFGCARCSQKYQPTPEEYKEFIHDLTKGEYMVLSDYINTDDKVKFFHNTCKRDFDMSPNHFHNSNNRCPHCASESTESRHVTFIKSLLESMNIDYEQEVKFEECKYKKLLPFDFYIPIKNKDEFLLIEFDGEQHFKGWNSNSESVEVIKKRDSIKTEFCKKYEIPLLRLNYTYSDNEIETSIKNLLEKNYS